MNNIKENLKQAIKEMLLIRNNELPKKTWEEFKKELIT